MRGNRFGVHLVIAVMLASVVALCQTPAVAGALPVGIYGTVSTAAGPIPGIEVAAFLNDGGAWYYEDSTMTDASGAYSLGLAPGTYRVSFTDWGNQTFKQEWYNNSSTFAGAQSIVIGASTAFNANAVLEAWPRGTIRGTITDSDDFGIPGITVQTYTWDQVESRWTMGLGSATQITDDDGSYEFADTLAQNYVIEFRDDNGMFKAELYNNKYAISSANPVTVTEGGTVTANASLAAVQYGSVAGVVTDSSNGAFAPGVDVSGYAPNLFGDWEWGFSAETMSLGDYRATGVPTGSYHVLFSDYMGRYVQEFYPNAANESGATWVGVAPLHTTSSINASLDRAAHIKGRITAAGTGAPLKAYATIYKWDPSALAWQDMEAGYPSNANGYYDIGGLGAGEYAVGFQDPYNMYFDEFYNDIPRPADDWSVPAGVTRFTLTAGQVRTGIDAALARGGSIVGTVTNSSGKPLSGYADEARVHVYDATTHGELWWLEAYPDEKGEYRCGPLPAGDYHIEFDGLGRYISMFYNGMSRISIASVVHVSSGAETTGINQALSPSGTWGVVDGSVTDTDTGDPLYGISVGLIATDGSSLWVDEVTTNGSGSYHFSYVEAGEYWLMFRDQANQQYRDVMYLNVDPDDGWASATPVVVPGGGEVWAPQRMTPEDDALGHIKGFVKRDGLLTPIVDAPVNAYQYQSGDDEWCWGGEARTGADGTYHLPVRAGQYRLEYGPTYDAAKEYYNDRASFSSASTVTVAPNGSVTANAYLAAAKTASGTVFYNGSPMQWASVAVFTWNAESAFWEYVDETYTASDGTYSIGGLKTGESYRFGCTSEEGSFAYIFYNDQPSVDMADSVVMDSNKTGLNFTLTEAGVVRGAVVDQDGHRVTDVTVKLWAKDAGNNWAVAQTSDSYEGGDFRFDGLQSPHDYWISFEDPLGRYRSAWYNSTVSSTTSATAEAVASVPGESIVIIQKLIASTTKYLPIAGISRINTAIAAAQVAFPEGAQTVVIATAYNWPDALGGAALAGAYQGPILLTAPDELPDSVVTAIEDLGATDAIILGGESAVSADVQDALDEYLGSNRVTRIGGTSRYRTANLIAKATTDRLGAAYDGTAFVATGYNFPDALGASPLAARASWPIFLADPVKGIGSETLTMMRTAGVKKALVLGGMTAVPAPIQTDLNSQFGSSNVIRIDGSSRYETCVNVAQYGVDHVYGLGWNNVAIATGQNFPDALAGGVLQGQRGSVLLLTPGTSLDAKVAAKLTAKKATITNVTYLGGLNAVNEAVRTAIRNILN